MLRFESSINLPEIAQGLEEFQASLRNFSGVLGSIADDFRQMVSEQFASHGEAGGTPWAELAPSTARRRLGGAMLESTGTLFRSLTDGNAPGHVEMAEQLSLEIGTNVSYALYHELGAGWGEDLASLPPEPRHGRGVPMRRLLVLTPERTEHWLSLIAQELETEAGAAGLAQLGGEL